MIKLFRRHQTSNRLKNPIKTKKYKIQKNLRISKDKVKQSIHLTLSMSCFQNKAQY